MIYNYRKYKNIKDFVENIPGISIDYTILHECHGLNQSTLEFTNRCFGCAFCFLKNKPLYDKFITSFGSDFIKSLAYKFFSGNIIALPNARCLINNQYKNLADFTATKETRHIQPWAAGLIQHCVSHPNNLTMELPVDNLNYDRSGRIDICIKNANGLLAFETKTCLDDMLSDQRFIEQYAKYTQEIQKYTDRYCYLTLIGGKETDLLPTSFGECTSLIGRKSDVFYKLLVENRLQFISVPALFGLCCKFIEQGSKFSLEKVLFQIFNDNENIGLTSAGIINYHDGKFTIIKL